MLNGADLEIQGKVQLRTAYRVFWVVLGSTLIFVYRLREAVFGDGSLFRGYDGAIQSYPWLLKVTRAWRDLDPPLWDFQTFSGTSFIGELQTGALYPVTIIWAWIVPPEGKSLEALIVAHHVLAFGFMALLMRKLRFSPPASLLASISFSSYLDWSQPNRMFGMIFLPLILFFFLKCLEHEAPVSNPWLYAAGAALAASLLAGHHQPFIHSSFCLAIFSAVVTLRFGNIRRNVLAVGGIGFSALLFSAPQILLSWEYLGNAYRWIPNQVIAFSKVPFEQYVSENTLHPQLLDYIARSWMPVVMILSVAALFRTRSQSRRRLAVYALLLGSFSFLASLGPVTPLGALTWHVPVLNLVRETERFLFPFFFAVSLLLGLVVDALIDALHWLSQRFFQSPSSSGGPDFRLWQSVLVTLGLGLWVWTHSALYLYVQPGSEPLSPSVLYPPVSASPGSTQGRIMRALFDFYDEEGGQCRILNYDHALAPNLGNVYSRNFTSGHRATMYAPYFDFLEARPGPPRSRRLDQLGACFAVSKEPLDLPLLLQEGDYFVSQRPSSLRVFRLSDEATINDASPLPVEKIDWFQNRVDVTLSAPVSGRLIFSQLVYPGWEVLVDQQERKLLNTDGFLSVALEPQDRKVTFAYRPYLLKRGLALAALPFIAFLGALLGSYRRE